MVTTFIAYSKSNTGPALSTSSTLRDLDGAADVTEFNINAAVPENDILLVQSEKSVRDTINLVRGKNCSSIAPVGAGKIQSAKQSIDRLGRQQITLEIDFGNESVSAQVLSFLHVLDQRIQVLSIVPDPCSPTIHDQLAVPASGEMLISRNRIQYYIPYAAGLQLSPTSIDSSSLGQLGSATNARAFR